jgi:hypothetical protein
MPSSFNSFVPLFSFGDDATPTPNNPLFLRLEDYGTIQMQLQGQTGEVPTDAWGNVALGQWLHVCVTFKSAVLSGGVGTQKLYLNGALRPGAASGTSSASVEWAISGSSSLAKNKVWFGGLGPQYASYLATSAPGSNYRAFHGKMDELRIYAAELAAADVLAGYSTNIWPSTAALIAYYPFSDEMSSGSGDTTCYDHSGNGRHWINCIQAGISAREGGSLHSNCLPNPSISGYCRNVVDGC